MAGENAIRYSMLPNVIVVICGNIEPQVTLAQFLDQHFMWLEHIKIICNETCKNIWILNQLVSSVPEKVLLNLYYSEIYSWV